MVITPYDLPEDILDIDAAKEIYNRAVEAKENGDTKLIFANAPVTSEYPKDQGISFILEEILALEEFTTKEVSNVLMKYIDFIEKYKIELIKEFDHKCTSVYEGELPNIKVDKLEVQTYFGYDKFQIMNSDTLSRDQKGLYLQAIDYSFALDSNAASNFRKYYEKKDEQYKVLYELLSSDQYNIDLFPYIVEIIMNGIKTYGVNYKLNKNNKNIDQQEFIKNLKVFHKHGFSREKLEKKFINNLIRSANPLIKHIGYMYYSAYILTIIMMEAKLYFKDSKKKIKNHVFTELRMLGIPIESRYRAILYLFINKPGHKFFEKIININNNEKYFHSLDNTARDIALSNLDKSIYFNLNNDLKGVFPLLASDDTGFIEMLQDTKPDFILRDNRRSMYIYKDIQMDLQKNYSEFFIAGDSGVYNYEDTNLKELAQIAKDKKQSFKDLVAK